MWKVLETNLDGSEQNSPSIVMDRDGHPFCAWIDGSAVKLARFRGDIWEYLGDRATVIDSSNPQLAKNCLTIDESGNPHIVLAESEKLKYFSWNGTIWEVEDICDREGLAGWAICIFEGTPMVTTLSLFDGFSTIRMYAFESGSWTFKDGIDMPAQVIEAPDLIIKVVDKSIYAFWINRNIEESWVAHVIYRTASSVWQGFWSKLVYHSEVDGDITGLDFVAEDEDWSSSESSSSSVSS